MESKPVVVGIDGSAASKEALRWASEQSERVGAPLVALISWEIPTMYGWPTYDDADIEKQARETAETAIRETVGQRPVEVRVKRGHAAASLVDASRDASLLVVGQRGHSEFRDLMLGSVSQHCVHHAHCPVVVVRGDRGSADR